MKKRILHLILYVLLTLPCLVPILFCRLWLDTDIGCFGTLFPSPSQIAERTLVTFPPTTANLKWRCYPSLDAVGVALRFTIDPSDLEQITTDAEGYYRWFPGKRSLPVFFDRFDDHPGNEEDLNNFQTWQITSRCGWTNNLADMDDPNLYTIYMLYSDIEHCELYSQMATQFATEATQTAFPTLIR